MKTKFVTLNLRTTLSVLVMFFLAGTVSASVLCGEPPFFRIIINEKPRDSDLKINDKSVNTEELKDLVARLALFATEGLIMVHVEAQVPAYRLMETLNILYDAGFNRLVLVPFGLHSIPARQVNMVEHDLEIMPPARLDPTASERIPEYEPKVKPDPEPAMARTKAPVKVVHVVIPGRERMANSVLVYAFLATWIVYLILMYAWYFRAGFRLLTIISLSHAVPSVIALAMAYIFLIRGGTTSIQFVIGLESEIYLWSLWLHIWPMMLYAAVISGGANMGWLLAACVRKPWRKWIPIAMAAVGLAVFAFVTVRANYPQ